MNSRQGQHHYTPSLRTFSNDKYVSRVAVSCDLVTPIIGRVSLSWHPESDHMENLESPHWDIFHFKIVEKHGHCSLLCCHQLSCDSAVNSVTHARQTKSWKRTFIFPVLIEKVKLFSLWLILNLLFLGQVFKQIIAKNQFFECLHECFSPRLCHIC